MRVDVNDALEVAAAEDQQPLEALAAQASDRGRYFLELLRGRLESFVVRAGRRGAVQSEHVEKLLSTCVAAARDQGDALRGELLA
jgi:hypothetical protein